MKVPKLLKIGFIVIAIMSVITLADLYLIKGILPLSQAIKTSIFMVFLGFLYVITGTIIWDHADATISTNEGAWLLVEPLIGIAVFVCGCVTCGLGMIVYYSNELSKKLEEYIDNPMGMIIAVIFIISLFTAYYFHIKKLLRILP